MATTGSPNAIPDTDETALPTGNLRELLRTVAQVKHDQALGAPVNSPVPTEEPHGLLAITRASADLRARIKGCRRTD